MAGTYLKILISVGLSSIAIDAVYLLVRHVIQKTRPAKLKKKEKNVIFFTDLCADSSCLSLSHDYQNCPAQFCPVRNEKKITNILASATSTLDICLYSISHTSLEITIKNLIEKGVKVRVVTDKNKAGRNEGSLSRLRSYGAFVEEKSCEPLKPLTFTVSELHMHHKFAIVDGTTLLTGSLNWTRNSFQSNWDHLIISSDPFLVSQFQKEFVFLFSDYLTPTLKGKRISELQQKPAQNQIKPNLDQPSAFKVYFFRREGVECRPHINWKQACTREPFCSFTVFQEFLCLLGKTTSSLDLCTNQFTLEDYSLCVIKLHERGVRVRYICDRKMAPGSGSQVQKLIDAGIDVRMRSTDCAMHHKWFALDRKLVASGSLNWTMQSFCGNYENIILTSSQDIVSEYCEHFDFMWNCFEPAEKVLWGNEATHRRYKPNIIT